MQRPGYERFALVSNPFHDLASDSLEELEVYHVVQEADDAFERMKQEVLEGTRKALVMVVGPLGSGKTQRLRVTLRQAEQVEAFAHYLNLGEAPPDPVAALAEALAAAVAKRKVARGLVAPRWARDLHALAKGKPLNPETAGRTLAEALGALAPSYLLLNDLDAVHGPVEGRLLATLLALASHLRDGVLVAIACQGPHFARLNERAGPLMSRVNRVVDLRGLTDAEAELLLAKRMAGRRLIEDLDPVYPFSRAGIAELNRAAGGTPRRLLQLADLVLDAAVKERAFQIGAEVVQAALARAGPLLDHEPVTAGTTPTVPARAAAPAAPAEASGPVTPAGREVRGPDGASAAPAPAAAQPAAPGPPSAGRQAALAARLGLRKA